MQITFRKIFEELLWITFSFGLTVLIASIFFGWSLLKGNLDLHLHDTYIVISGWIVLTPLFVLLTFTIYFIKEFRKSFGRTLSNWILIVIGLTIIISLTFLIQFISQLLITGTLYPPLSALSQDKVPVAKEIPVIGFVTNLLTIIQAVVLGMLLFVAYRWGAHKTKKV